MTATTATATAPTKPKILCVDDEPNVVAGLARHLNPEFQVVTATSGVRGLGLLETDGPFIVIMSDMRMPIMDGAAFLNHARQMAPDAIRILLTGYAEVESAISAVNDGQIFRFLTKPCPPDQLLKAVRAAVEQHRLVTAERVLLEQTVLGAVRTLTDVMGLANPIAFGRANRIKKHVSLIAEHLAIPDRWQVEVAALLSQIGAVTLAPHTLNKVYFGKPLTLEESAQVDEVPAVLDGLLAHIPRLEPVREMLARMNRLPQTGRPHLTEHQIETVTTGAHLLKIAIDFDALETKGLTADKAFEAMKERAVEYDLTLLDAFIEVHKAHSSAADVREIPLPEIQKGMVFADDVKSPTGAVMIPRGFTVTPSLVNAIQKYSVKLARLSVKVIAKG